MVARVQALAWEGLIVLPPQFIRPLHERPENSKAVAGVSVPLISMSLPHDDLVREMYKASNEWGFFLAVDHGLSTSLIERLQEVGAEFFRLPQEEKEKYANDASNGKFEGYGTKMTKNLDEKIEWIDYFFHVMSPPSKVNYEVWPANPPSYRYIHKAHDQVIRASTLVYFTRTSPYFSKHTSAYFGQKGGLLVDSRSTSNILLLQPYFNFEVRLK